MRSRRLRRYSMKNGKRFFIKCRSKECGGSEGPACYVLDFIIMWKVFFVQINDIASHKIDEVLKSKIYLGSYCVQIMPVVNTLIYAVIQKVYF